MMPGRRHGSALVWLVVAVLPALPAAAQVRLGREFQVNTYTPSAQHQAAVRSEPNGDFVVAFESSGEDGEVYGIFGRRFTSAGGPLAVEFQISVRTLDNEYQPALDLDADGDFVVAWTSRNQDGFGNAVFARRFASSGDAIGDDFQVNTYTTFAQEYPDVALDDDGDFVVVWQSYHQDGSVRGVFGRRFSSAGAGLGGEFQISVYTTSHQKRAAIGMDAAGDFVVAWQSYGEDGSADGVFARRFASTGAALGGELQVNAYTTGIQEVPAIAVESDGDFIVAWSSAAQDGSIYGVFARRYSSAGVSQAGEFQVNAYTSLHQRYPVIAAGTDGDFLVSWNSTNQDGSSYGIFARRFSSAGVPLAVEFQANGYTQGYQRFSTTAALPNGRFVVAWSSSQDGASEGVFAQRFALTAILDVDGNGSLGPLTDGLLVLRWIFGFTGTTLTANAVGGGCTRCDAAAIQTYLAGLGATLDIDGTGPVLGALTDGLLVLRWLFGFTGTTLTANAVGAGCTRCDGSTIEPYLAGLVP
jgi:hypothetical protein